MTVPNPPSTPAATATPPAPPAPAQPKDATTTSGGTSGGGQTDPEAAAGGDDDLPADLGDAGQRALRAERAKARTEAKARQKLEAEIAELRAKASGPSADAPVDAKAIAEAAKAEARAELLKDRALDKIEVVAAKTFANPDLAVRLLKSDVGSFIANGAVDTDAIKDALADLLDANPGLAATPAKRFTGTGDGGVRGGGNAPDLDTQIAAARAAGDVRQQIHLQNQKLLPQIQKIAQGLSS